MFLTYCPDGSLVEVKQELRFPSGEPLPRCWLDPAYGRS
jgi:hypothetical protein